MRGSMGSQKQFGFLRGEVVGLEVRKRLIMKYLQSYFYITKQPAIAMFRKNLA